MSNRATFYTLGENEANFSLKGRLQTEQALESKDRSSVTYVHFISYEMMTISDYILDDYTYFSEVASSISTKPIAITKIDFSHGEASFGTLLSLDKSVVNDKKEAIILLKLKLMLVREEWVDPTTQEEIDWYYERLMTDYGQDPFYPVLSVTDRDFVDMCLGCLSLTDMYIRSIIHNQEEISKEAFLMLSPLQNETVMNLAASDVSWNYCEYYIETQSKYVLYHWFTTA
jgi:hypothetical protein